MRANRERVVALDDLQAAAMLLRRSARCRVAIMARDWP